MANGYLPNVLPTFAIGSTVGLYTSITTDAGWPKPTGAQITSAVVAPDGSLTFTGLTNGRTYAAAQLQGQTWRFLELAIEPAGKAESVAEVLELLEAHEADSTNVHGIVNTGQLVTDGKLQEVKEALESLIEEVEGGGGAVSSVNGKTGAVVLAAADVGAQPSDSDLTAIAALSTTSYGRAFLALADAAAGRTALGLGTAATTAASAYDVAGAATTAETNAKAASQPLDSDLTSIAALSTTTFGRSLLTMAAAANARTALELGTAATQASGAFDAAGAASAAQAASQPLDSDLTAIAALATNSFGRALLTKGTAAEIRTYIEAAKSGEGGSGLTEAEVKALIAAEAQPKDADLTAIAALTTAEFGRSLLTQASASAARSTLGLGTAAVEAATAFQPTDSDLTAIAALTTTTFGRALLTMVDAAATRTAIEAQKTLGAGDVSSTMIAGEAITEGKIATGAVGTNKIANGSVGPEKLEAEGVQTSRIKDLNVTTIKLANTAVTAGKLATDAVETAKIKAEAVTEEKLAAAVKTKLAGASQEPRGFSVISSVEAVTYRGFYEPVASGETKKLVGMKYSIGSGTSAKITIKQNGTAITSFKELLAETTAAEVSGKSVSVAAGDRFDLTVEAVTGTPKDLIITLFFENTR